MEIEFCLELLFEKVPEELRETVDIFSSIDCDYTRDQDLETGKEFYTLDYAKITGWYEIDGKWIRVLTDEEEDIVWEEIEDEIFKIWRVENVGNF